MNKSDRKESFHNSDVDVLLDMKQEDAVIFLNNFLKIIVEYLFSSLENKQ